MIMVDVIKFSQMTPGGDITAGDQTPGLLGGANVLFNNPWTFLAPGSTASRPIPSPAVNGRLRFNTDTLIYEYYDTVSAMWTALSGSGTGTVNPGTANSIAFYAANGTAVSPTNALALAVLSTNVSGFPSLSTTLPTGLTIPTATITSSTAALTSGQVVAVPVNPLDLANKVYVDSLFGAGVTSITGTTNQVIASSPTGAVTLSLPQDIATGSTPTFAGLTLTSIPLNLTSGGTENSIPLTNGQLWIGDTGNPPARATLTAGPNISIVNAAGTITISATGLAGFSWTTVTGTSQAMLSNNGYVANNAGLVTLSLPATSAVGDEIDIIGKGAGGWKVQCGGGQTIVLGSSTTTSGGSLASTQAKDSFYMICTVANTEWTVASGPQTAGLTIA